MRAALQPGQGNGTAAFPKLCCEFRDSYGSIVAGQTNNSGLTEAGGKIRHYVTTDLVEGIAVPLSDGQTHYCCM